MKSLKFFNLLIVVFTFCLTKGFAQATRTEKDLLGEKQIPNDAYYGVQTARALENFQVSGIPTKFYPDYVRAYAIVKLAATGRMATALFLYKVDEAIRIRNQDRGVAAL